MMKIKGCDRLNFVTYRNLLSIAFITKGLDIQNIQNVKIFISNTTTGQNKDERHKRKEIKVLLLLESPCPQDTSGLNIKI
jgi:hypothetical protein